MLADVSSESDEQMLIDSPGFFSDKVYYGALRALREQKVTYEDCWKRFNLLVDLGLYQTKYSPNLYFTLLGVSDYNIVLKEYAIGKIKKYSGYVRNSSSVGSKRRSTSSIPEPEITEWEIANDIDYFYFFSVGELTSGLPGVTKLILTSPLKDETENPSEIVVWFEQFLSLKNGLS